MRSQFNRDTIAIATSPFPAARKDRGVAPTSGSSGTPGQPPAPPVRMRVFVLNFNQAIAGQKVSVTPSIRGPSIIRGFGFWNSGGTWEFMAGTRILVATDNNTGIENQTAGTAVTGTLIWEALQNNNAAAPPAGGLTLGHLDQIATAASRIISPYEFPLDYLVTLPEFFIKVVHMRSADVVEGYLRVLEGADANFL